MIWKQIRDSFNLHHLVFVPGSVVMHAPTVLGMGCHFNLNDHESFRDIYFVQDGCPDIRFLSSSLLSSVLFCVYVICGNG